MSYSWGLWWFPKKDKVIKKRDEGVVLYTKPKNEFVKSFKQRIVNRRLQTKRVQSHDKK